MSKDDPADERPARANYQRSLEEMEAAAAEIVKAALALPLGPERVAALRAAKIDRKH